MSGLPNGGRSNNLRSAGRLRNPSISFCSFAMGSFSRSHAPRSTFLRVSSLRFWALTLAFSAASIYVRSRSTWHQYCATLLRRRSWPRYGQTIVAMQDQLGTKFLQGLSYKPADGHLLGTKAFHFRIVQGGNFDAPLRKQLIEKHLCAMAVAITAPVH